MPTIPTGELEREMRKRYLRFISGLSMDAKNLDQKLRDFEAAQMALIERLGGRTAMLGALGDFPAPKSLDLSPYAGTVYDEMQTTAIRAGIIAGSSSREAAQAMFRAGMDKSYRKLERLARTETVQAYWKNAWGSIADLPALVMLWGSEDGPRTCQWCKERDGLVMDGPGLRDHPNGRCTPIPTLRSQVQYRGSISQDGQIYHDPAWKKPQLIQPAPARVEKTFSEIFEDGDERYIMAQLAGKYEGRDYAGFTVKLNEIEYTDIGAGVRMSVLKDGKEAGYINRVFAEDGRSVYHDTMELHEQYRGKGFSSAFSAHSEEMYRQSGITRINLTAGLDDGGYVWAKAGYQLDADFYRTNPTMFKMEMRELQRSIAEEAAFYYTDEGVAGVLSAWESMIDEVLDEGPDALDMLDLSQLANLFNKDGRPIGRSILGGTSWRGVKSL